MIELLRRLVLLACTAYGVWLAAWCPPALLSVRVANFEEEYAKKFTDKPGRRIMGAMELADEFIRENANPGSAANYREAKTQGHVLTATPSDPAGWLREVRTAGTAWYRPTDPRIALLWRSISELRNRTQYNAVYLRVADGAAAADLEILWHSNPKDTRAPAATIFPYRPQGWAWIALGLLAYFVIPGLKSQPGEARRDPVVIESLDLLAALFFGLLFYWPLYLSHTPGEALDEVAGLTGFLWAFAALMALQLLVNAAWAARRIQASAGVLQLRSLSGLRTVALADIAAAQPWDDGPQRKGWRLLLKHGAPLDIDWNTLVDFESVQATLSSLPRKA